MFSNIFKLVVVKAFLFTCKFVAIKHFLGLGSPCTKASFFTSVLHGIFV